jgi:hypothetical protein
MAKKLIAFARKLVEFIVRIITRYPYAIALFGFVSGVSSFLLVEREQEKFAQMLSLLMLVSWLWLALENLLRRGVSSWFGISLPPPLVSFATQLVHQESLFFVIPFFLPRCLLCLPSFRLLIPFIIVGWRRDAGCILFFTA